MDAATQISYVFFIEWKATLTHDFPKEWELE